MSEESKTWPEGSNHWWLEMPLKMHFDKENWDFFIENLWKMKRADASLEKMKELEIEKDRKDVVLFSVITSSISVVYRTIREWRWVNEENQSFWIWFLDPGK